MTSSTLCTEGTTQLFRALVDDAVEHQKVAPSADSVTYLVQLLDEFVHPAHLFARTETDSDQPVAEVFCHGVSSGGMRRFSLLKLSGDLSLFTAGFLSDSLQRKAVDVDYYCKLGGTAYATAAGSCASNDVASLFQELAQDFVCFVDLLSEVSEQCSLTDSENDLRLYEKWTLIGSRHSADLLRGRGVQVVPVTGTVH